METETSIYNEFNELISEISKEIIETSVLDDVKVSQQLLANEVKQLDVTLKQYKQVKEELNEAKNFLNGNSVDVLKKIVITVENNGKDVLSKIETIKKMIEEKENNLHTSLIHALNRIAGDVQKNLNENSEKLNDFKKQIDDKSTAISDQVSTLSKDMQAFKDMTGTRFNEQNEKHKQNMTIVFALLGSNVALTIILFLILLTK